MMVTSEARHLICALSSVGSQLIAIDGWHRSGKTWLGRSAASVMKRNWLDLDRLLERKQDAFVDCLDLSGLREATQNGGPLILSGVCMREVLARVGNPEAIHVYVKRMHLGYWTQEEEVRGHSSDIDKHFPPGALELEVRSYHELFKPHEKATFIYERPVNASGL